MSQAVKLAEHYFALSNAGKLDEIETLLTASSTYSSANTGVFLGAEQIMGMQRAFFSSFKKIGWDVHNIEEVRPGVVLFDFTFSGVTNDDEKINRPGLEYVVVYNGKLQHVEVRNKR